MSDRILGAAWPRHFNTPIAESMNRHIKAVGLPTWSPEDQVVAKALQKEVENTETTGLAMKLDTHRRSRADTAHQRRLRRHR